MNDEILIELGDVSEETLGIEPPFNEGQDEHVESVA